MYALTKTEISHNRTCQGCKLCYEKGERDLTKSNVKLKSAVSRKELWRYAPIARIIPVNF